jgi:hypothetical protein
MSHDLICTWLGLPPGGWPPDHYRLLGLEPGEDDPARMEQSVHQRLDAVRRYQLIHPEEATEAMNRLAQAFVCLTDPEAKRAYDGALFGTPPEPEEASAEPAAEEVYESHDPLAWLYDPASLEGEGGAIPVLSPAVEEAAPSEQPAPAEAPTVAATEEPAGNGVAAAPAPAPVPKEPVDHAAEAARSKPARRGLGTTRALYQRVVATRRLLRVWELAGKYLAAPDHRLTRRSEAIDLIRQMNQLRELLEEFPPLLGKAGQSGYLVASLARQQLIVPTFQTMGPSQRETLSRDWNAGRHLLLAHRDFLRQEMRALRRRSALGRFIRAVRASINDHPGIVLVVLSVLAVLTVVLRTFVL